MTSRASATPATGQPDEQALRLAHLAAIVESSQDAIISKTLESVITSWNPAAEQLFGYTAAEAVGQPMALIIPPERLAEEAQIIATIRRGERVEHFDTQRRRKDGALLDVSVSISPIKDPAGRIVGASKIVRDLSDRQRAQAALAASEKRYRSLFNNMLQGYAFCRLLYAGAKPVDFIFIEVNEQYEALTGLREVAGRWVRDLIPDLPQTNPEMLETYGRVAATGQPERFESFVAPLGRWFAISAYSPEPGFFVAVLDDITERKRASQALRDSEARLAAMIDNAMDAIITIDADERIMLFNRAAEQIFGYPTEAMLGQPLSRLLPEALREAHHAHVQRFAATGITARAMGALQPLSGRRADGTTFPIEAAISQIEAAGHKLYTVILRDVTERQRAEARNAYQARLLEVASDAIIATDENYNVTLWNAAAEALYGWPAADILGKQVVDVLKTEYHGLTIAQLRQLVDETGRWRAEATQQHRDGTRFAVDISAMTLRDEHGHISGSISVNRDISERKAAEARNAYLARLLEAVDDAIVATDENLRVTLWNATAETLYGWTAAEALGQNSRDLLHSEYPGLSRDDMRRQLADAGSWRGEATQTRRDGRRFPVEVNTILLRDGQGKINGYFSINRDISERKAAEAALAQQAEALRRSNADLEQFAYVASHDLQEPLRMVASYVQLLSRRYQGRLDADADEFIQYAVDGAQRMQQLINDLLAFSRVATRATPAAPAAAEAALAAALANLQVAMAESGAVITRADLPTVLIDPGQLTQLFQNLIANALKFHGPDAPRIEIGAEARGGEWLFHVRDNGRGLDPQFAERIFVIFQRLHTRAEYPGTGIGLAICKKIVERCGGRIWVESQPGQGATFYFTLPDLEETRDATKSAD